MVDRIFRAFLEHQAREAEDLARGSDVVAIHPWPAGQDPAQQYLVEFRTRTVVHRARRALVTDSGCAFQLRFPFDYLRRVEPWMVLSCLGPMDLFHPNIRPPSVCIGRIEPGTTMADLVCRLFDLVTFRKWASHDALNRDAAQWARQEANAQLFPTDRRPLRRRTLVLKCDSEDAAPGGTPHAG